MLLARLLDAYDRLREEAREAERAGRDVDAVTLYRTQLLVIDDLYAEAARLGLTLPHSGRLQDDLEAMRRHCRGDRLH